MRRLGYQPALDGIRGLAVLAVMGAHASVPGTLLGGFVGVELFFVLSGFLITNLLVEEHRLTGTISLRAFYVRRCRRLLPALGLFLVAMSFVAVVIHPVSSGPMLRGIASSATYLTNIARTQSVDLGPLNHLWSLAVEEHFYIVWPAVLALVLWRRGERAALAVAVAGIVASSLLRELLLKAGWDRVYNGSDTRASGLLVGCCAALVLADRPAVRHAQAAVVAGGLLLVWSTAGYGPALTDPFRGGLALIDLASALMLVGLVSTRDRTTACLSWRPLVHVGRLSYGLYLWHVPVLASLGALNGHRLRAPHAALGFALSFGAAEVSMRLVESRFRARSQGGSRSPGARRLSEPPSAPA